MTTLIHMREISKDWNGKTLFGHVNMEVNESERIALFGRNGCGKTTLLNILTGSEQPTAGTLTVHLESEEIGFMRQDFKPEEHWSVKQIAFVESGTWGALKMELQEAEEQLASEPDSSPASLERYGEILEQYEAFGGYAREAELERMMTHLSIGEVLWDRPFSSLSGGQKTRLRLAALLTRKPRLLILDEPTNHLDHESMTWLEEWMLSYSGTLVFVSHDRTFLDRVATSICELTYEGTRKYPGGYEEYKEQKEREKREQAAKYRQQELAKKALEESIRKYQEWFKISHRNAGNVTESRIAASYYKARANKNISRYHAKQKQLERLEGERVERPREGPKVSVELKEGEFGARNFVQLRDVEYTYLGSQTPVFSGVDLAVERGKRIALQGMNGAGKTTLLKLITGELSPQKGEVNLHARTKIGYFSQELEGLQPEMTLLDSLLINPFMTQTEARTMLGNFLFSRDDVFKKIGDLSMGEKCRAAFIRLYFSGSNLLVLDEPTNYLDIDTREVMEEALLSYEGSLVFVSHDRTLVRKLANQLLQMGKHEPLRIFDGTVEEYEEHLVRKSETPEEREEEDLRIQLQHRLNELLTGSSYDQANPGQPADVESYYMDSATLQEIRELRSKLAALQKKDKGSFK
ncbi:ribosomal protection-like ABC-F family protein [Paenibacillus sp. 453mf]|uniref:ribosomal protection-like ABC-F family protein n=1 Tax=Paenibacillus sp. 453mf TaxID=1761874 RepID=UPI0008E977BA|nr:ABC-F type ribosomal protection protein [Paenibacillus sp. 453mf]SFS43092.1 macrolide transport system ATP-binding/permease protein [Paenibacillus sp. 453mf]